MNLIAFFAATGREVRTPEIPIRLDPIRKEDLCGRSHFELRDRKIVMVNRKYLSTKEYRENHLNQMRKKIIEEMDHHLDLSSEGGIVQVIANDLPLDQERRH